jgi:hypothetical protein
VIPPAKKIRVSIPDLPLEEEMEPEDLLALCQKLKINPKVFGFPWN